MCVQFLTDITHLIFVILQQTMTYIYGREVGPRWAQCLLTFFQTKMSKQFTAPRARLSIRRIAFIKQKIDNLWDNSNDFSETFTGDRFLVDFF